jgi:hypothetical protein
MVPTEIAELMHKYFKIPQNHYKYTLKYRENFVRQLEILQ